jgi:hypothetical protein
MQFKASYRVHQTPWVHVQVEVCGSINSGVISTKLKRLSQVEAHFLTH